jgi:hypothetical protein
MKDTMLMVAACVFAVFVLGYSAYIALTCGGAVVQGVLSFVCL